MLELFWVSFTFFCLFTGAAALMVVAPVSWILSDAFARASAIYGCVALALGSLVLCVWHFRKQRAYAKSPLTLDGIPDLRFTLELSENLLREWSIARRGAILRALNLFEQPCGSQPFEVSVGAAGFSFDNQFQPWFEAFWEPSSMKSIALVEIEKGMHLLRIEFPSSGSDGPPTYFRQLPFPEEHRSYAETIVARLKAVQQIRGA